MASPDEMGDRKGTVEVGSGDFQPNPIYGDQPQSYGDGTTYNEDPDELNQGGDDYEYPQNDEEDDANNPFAGNGGDQQEYGQDQQEYGNDGYDQGVQQQNAPPPYSEDPPAPPQAYSEPQGDQQETYGNGTNEPEDVVAQMNGGQQQQQYNDEDVGDYGVTQPKTEDGMDEDGENGEGLMGNFLFRTLFMASAFFWTSMMAMAIWFRNSDEDISSYDDIRAGYGLCGFAAFIIFLGSIVALVWGVMTKMGRPVPFDKWVLWSIIGMYVTGGLFYFLGGCAVAYGWNSYGSDVLDGFVEPNFANPVAGIFFTETTFVGLHAMLAGIDLWKRKFLNNKKWRSIIYNVLFFFLALVCFFAYAVCSTNFDNLKVLGVDFPIDNAGPAFCALFYFMIMIPQVIYMLVYLIPKVYEKLGKPIILLILAGSFVICAVCLLIGYFILTGSFINITFPDTDGNGNLIESEISLVKGRAYFLGIGVFVLMTATAIGFDMLFDRFIPGYKDGGNSVSDKDAQGVPTTNPDSQDSE